MAFSGFDTYLRMAFKGWTPSCTQVVVVVVVIVVVIVVVVAAIMLKMKKYWPLYFIFSYFLHRGGEINIDQAESEVLQNELLSYQLIKL